MLWPVQMQLLERDLDVPRARLQFVSYTRVIKCKKLTDYGLLIILYDRVEIL